MIITWPAPAKLNLFLYITGRRPDGYHELQTLFQFLDYGDTLEITADYSGEITLLTPLKGVPLAQNLIICAAQALKQAAAIRNGTQLSLKNGAQISLKKRLPMGGGLGGGSSDAATVLVALNHLWQTALSEDELVAVGAQLGADVPVFVRGRAAFASGEQMKFVEPVEKWYLVTYPGVSIATPDLFQDPALTRNSPIRTLDELLQRPFYNDCEEVARKRFREVDELLAWLLEYAPSRLTGTGACVFAEFNTEFDARKVLEIAPKWICGFVARGLNLSPLQHTISGL